MQQAVAWAAGRKSNGSSIVTDRMRSARTRKKKYGGFEPPGYPLC